MKATQKLHELGQSVWLDNITRDLLTSGTLRRYIAEIVEHAPRGIEFFVLVLCEVVRLDVVPELQRALGERLGASEQFDQR